MTWARVLDIGIHPAGNMGGSMEKTHHKLFCWGGKERRFCDKETCHRGEDWELTVEEGETKERCLAPDGIVAQ